jgi:putative aldouronate transport system substrate-binding protein
MSSGEIKGLGWIFGGSYMVDYYADGATLDLKPYVEQNPNWMAMPEDMREFNVRDGALLALPSSWAGGLAFNRSIRVDWLENLGLEMPETIYDLYEVSKAFTFDDPDGNGEDDTIGMTSAGVWNMQDIFMSFGVPTNHVGAHLITPDPHDGLRYNDGMLKPGARAALEWLKRVYDEGIMDQEVFVNGGSQMRERMSSGKYGSTFYWGSWGVRGSFENRIKNVVPEAKIDIILGLTSDYADEYVNFGGVMGGGAPWVLIAGTKNPQEQVDAFIDIYHTDPVGYWTGRYGIYEKFWDFGPNNELVRQIKSTDPETGKHSYYPGPGIVGDNHLYDHVKHPHVLDQEPPENTAKRARDAQRMKDYLDEGLSSKLIYTHSGAWNEPTSQKYNDIGADINRIFEETVAKAVTGQVPIDEALADYRQQLKALGAQQMLDEANAAIGKTSSTQWRY